MKKYQFYNELKLKASIENIWLFLSNPKNLKVITPKSMHLKLLNESEINGMHKGLTLHYSVTPILGIPMKWSSKITEIEEKHHFIDEQLKGPY